MNCLSILLVHAQNVFTEIGGQLVPAASKLQVSAFHWFIVKTNIHHIIVFTF
jgi:hypothetical protein